MFGLGMQELVIILVIILVLFGAKRLPELASGMGKAIKNFKKASNEPDEIDVTPKKSVEADTATEVKKEAAGEDKTKGA
jgi:sec-independent protein translocase protein TatA